MNLDFHFELESLEDRRLLSWGTYPQLINQALASGQHPSINGAGVSIAVIDSGVDATQPYLAGKIDTAHGWDFYQNDSTPQDQNGHGTAMAGIIASAPFTYGGATYAGIAQGVKIIPLKVADPTGAYSFAFSQRVEQALKWVEANYKAYNIKVVNMSLWAPKADYLATCAGEVARLAADGVFMVAAGNQLDPNQNVTYPAADPNVFGVSVVKANGTFPTDTVNRGPGINLLAPGDGVPILLRGGGIGVSAEATSYSTPFVSATAALLYQIHPTFTPTQIASILKDSGVNVKDTSVGYTYSGLTYKRLNVERAIDLAFQRGAPAELPFWGKPFSTNSIIQAEDYDEGGEGVGFHNIGANNVPGRYRLIGPDIERTADTGGGYDITMTKPGEWLNYSIRVTTTGTFKLAVRVAAMSSGGSFHLNVDGVNRSGTMSIPKTGGSQAWTTINSPAFSVTAGRHIIRLVFDTSNATGNGAGNINWLSLNAVSAKVRPVARALIAPVMAPSSDLFASAAYIRDGLRIQN